MEEDTNSSLSIQPNQYRLIQLFKVNDYNSKIPGGSISEICTKVQNDVYHLEKLSDGSWELLVLDAKCDSYAHSTKIFPGWCVNLEYDPESPTHVDLAHWKYAEARRLRRDWFCERAKRIISQDIYPAAAYYKYHLENIQNTFNSEKYGREPSDDLLQSDCSDKDHIEQFAKAENDHHKLPASTHEATGSVRNLPLDPNPVVGDFRLLSIHQSKGSLYEDSTERDDLQYPIVDSPKGKHYYAARMEHPSIDGVEALSCYQKILSILRGHFPIAVIRRPSANAVNTFMLARVFMAKQYNTRVEIGLAYRGQSLVHVCAVRVGKFEDFQQCGVYFIGQPDIIYTIPWGQRWQTHFNTSKCQSWMGVQ